MPLSPRNRKKPRLRENRNGNAQFSFCVIDDSKMPDGLVAVRHFFIRADGRVLRLHSAFGILQSAFGVGGIAQLVERQLCKLDVRGSNPLASTSFARSNARKSGLVTFKILDPRARVENDNPFLGLDPPLRSK